VVQHLSEDWLALQAKAGASLPERPGVSGRLQHVVTGAPDGEVVYSLAFVDGRVADVALGRDDAAADCTFLVTHPDSVLIAKGELDLHAGFMQGRVKMSGDMGRLMAVLPCTQSDEYHAALADVAASTEF
jgi:hypothetical protein